MAQRRMFSMAVVDTDFFLEMPVSAQLLYFHLGMRADDDGFVSSPKRIMRSVGCAEDDLRLLIAKNFVIPFDSGVCVITDWRLNNLIRKDRYAPSIYITEKSVISVLSSSRYTIGQPNDNQRLPQWSIGEVSKEEDKCPHEGTSSSSSAVGFFLQNINPSASQLSLDEIQGFTKVLPEALVTHAMQKALDEKKTAWSYIRAILRNWVERGYTCLADVQAGDGKHGAAKEVSCLDNLL